MLLAVDIGNTNIKFGIFDREQLLSKHSVRTNSELTPDILKSLVGKCAIRDAVVCSVVPEKNGSITSPQNE